MSSNIQITKNCVFCGKEYIAKTLSTRYCSHSCNRTHYKKIKREEKVNNYNEQVVKAAAPDKATKPALDISIQQKDFLSIEETAVLLGASRRTIQRMIAAKKLRVTKLGSRSIISRKSIDKLFNI